jgi:hypothetical protein
MSLVFRYRYRRTDDKRTRYTAFCDISTVNASVSRRDICLHQEYTKCAGNINIQHDSLDLQQLRIKNVVFVSCDRVTATGFRNDRFSVILERMFGLRV